MYWYYFTLWTVVTLLWLEDYYDMNNPYEKSLKEWSGRE